MDRDLLKVKLDNSEVVILKDAFVSLHKELNELISGNNSLARIASKDVVQLRVERLEQVNCLASKLGINLHGESHLSFS